MTKIIKAQLVREGKIILRAKMLRTNWCVYQYSTKGRWQKAIGNYDCFVYKESCDSFIDALARNNVNIIRYE
jgi:hypothetical protein